MTTCSTSSWGSGSSFPIRSNSRPDPPITRWAKMQSDRSSPLRPAPQVGEHHARGPEGMGVGTRFVGDERSGGPYVIGHALGGHRSRGAVRRGDLAVQPAAHHVPRAQLVLALPADDPLSVVNLEPQVGGARGVMQPHTTGAAVRPADSDPQRDPRPRGQLGVSDQATGRHQRRFHREHADRGSVDRDGPARALSPHRTGQPIAGVEIGDRIRRTAADLCQHRREAGPELRAGEPQLIRAQHPDVGQRRAARP
jgi:hypothetical protein